MKFGDKLIQLRKKSGLSQEELAAKLNVSRQSVSKWESNNTYPETDKIIQICNIFDCTMDDLINENVKDITAIERKNKNQININIDSLLDFVTKTVNMFYNMSFLSGLKCLIELGIVAIVLIIIGLLINEVVTATIVNIFSFIPWKILNIISSIISGIIELDWIIITLIVIIHTFKIRYLNCYEQIVNENQEKQRKKEKFENSKEQQKEKVRLERNARIVIRDKDPFAFLNVFAKIIIWFIKSIAIMIGLFFAFILLLGVIGLVVSIALSTYSEIFIGIDIGIFGLIIATVLVLAIIIHFVLETKVNIKAIVISFFTSIIITGIGAGIVVTSIKDIEIKDDMEDIIEIKTNEVELVYKDNLIIRDEYPRSYEYIIDNSLDSNEIIVQNEYDPRFNKIEYYEMTYHGMPQYNFYLLARPNIKDRFSIIINDLKNNVIRNYDEYLYRDDIKIIANKTTIDKLLYNFSQIYVYDQEVTIDGYIISNISDRIISIYSECPGEYNALTGEIESEEYCKCIKEQKETSASEIIEYSCHYTENNYNE